MNERSPILRERGKERDWGGKRTCMISVRILGTSEKKVRAKRPATTPNDAAVAPLFRGLTLAGIKFVRSVLCAMGSGMMIISSRPRDASIMRWFSRAQTVLKQ